MERVDAIFAGLIISGIFIKFAARQFAAAQAVSEVAGKRAFTPALSVAGAGSLSISVLAFPAFPDLLDVIDHVFTLIAIAIHAGCWP